MAQKSAAVAAALGGVVGLAGFDGRELALGVLLVARYFSRDKDFERLAGMGNSRFEGGAVVADPSGMTIELAEIGFDDRPACRLG